MRRINDSQKNIIFWIITSVLFALSLFIAFYKLNIIVTESFDEARHGVNAYEMLKNKNYIVNTYQYKPDCWNLKPPLSSWLIVLGYKIFGFNMVGLKFYSSASFVLLLMLVCIYTKKRFGRKASVLSVFFILSLYILVDGHLVRYADTDMLYCLLFVASFISLFMKSDKRYIVCGLCCSLAFLTKSYHAALIFLCSGLSICILEKEKIFKKIVIYSVSFSVPVLVWAVLRYQYDGLDFFKAMLFTDVIRRAGSDIEQHGEPIWLYVLNIVISFKYIFFVVGLSAIARFYKKAKIIDISKESIVLLIWIILPVFLYSLSVSKWVWYVYPQYFLLCILCGIYVGKICSLNFDIVSVIVILSLLLPSRYILSNCSNVLHWENRVEPAQIFIHDALIEANTEYGEKIFFDIEEGAGQDLQLLSELYGDLIPADGTADDFLFENKKSYLMTDNLKPDKDIFADANIIKKDNEYILLKNVGLSMMCYKNN